MTKSPSWAEIVSGLTLLVGLAAAWLYVAGWTYAYAYFRGFHVPLTLVDLPHKEVFVFGALAFWKQPWPLLGSSLCLC